MAVALTDFSGFCGFRPPTQIASFLSSVPEFSTVIGSSASESFQSKFSSSSSSASSEDAKKEGLKEMFTALMKADEKLVREQVEKLLERVQGAEGIEKEEKELIETLNKDFPGDVGIFCTFVLNIVRLKPGEAVFLKANEPHAYLDGDIMECMATSGQSSFSLLDPIRVRVTGLTLRSLLVDNVVRAGLTPKLRDVPTLTTMLTYTSSPPSDQILPPVPFRSTKHTTLYDPPIDEFSVLLTVLEEGEKEKFEGIDGPSILIFTELDNGRASLGWKGKSQGDVEVKREGHG